MKSVKMLKNKNYVTLNKNEFSLNFTKVMKIIIRFQKTGIFLLHLHLFSYIFSKFGIERNKTK